MSKIQIVIVDDHRIVRQGLKSLLIGCTDIKIMKSVGTAKELFLCLKQRVPDIIILDIGLPDMSGLDVLKKLFKDKVDVKVIMLSALSTEENISNAVVSGASGFLPKDTSRDEFVNAIKIVHSGDVYFGRSISNIIYKSYVAGLKSQETDETELTGREIEVVKLICDGLIYKEIAENLKISIRTVETHKNNIFEKLQINNSIELVKYAIINKIIKI